MTAANFLAALAFTWRPENDGQPLHNDSNDPGGWTAWAVTQATWDEAVKRGIVAGSIVGASQDQCGQVLHALFWDAIRGDELPSGVDVQVFDIAVVDGPGRAARLLQHAVGAKEDGEIGPLTLASVALVGPADLLARVATADDEWLEGLGGFKYFGKGWERRAADCLTYASGLIVPSA